MKSTAVNTIALALMALLSGCEKHITSTCTCTNGRVRVPQQTQLTGAIVSCTLAPTGFLGIGAGRRAQVRIRNDSDVAGDFDVTVYGNYPGGGRIAHGRVPHLHVLPHNENDAVANFEARDGMQNVSCEASAPVVMTEREEICPHCHGQGVIHETRSMF